MSLSRAIASSSSNARQNAAQPGPCGACRVLRRRCTPLCPFAPYIEPYEAYKFRAIHQIFGASRAGRLIRSVPSEQRRSVVDALFHDARTRVRDPVHGCMGVIEKLKKELADVKAERDSLRIDNELFKFALLPDCVPRPGGQERGADNGIDAPAGPPPGDWWPGGNLAPAGPYRGYPQVDDDDNADSSANAAVGSSETVEGPEGGGGGGDDVEGAVGRGDWDFEQVAVAQIKWEQHIGTSRDGVRRGARDVDAQMNWEQNTEGANAQGRNGEV